MLHSIKFEPLVSESTPEAVDFTDRLHLLTHDVRLIELAAEGLRRHYSGDEEDVSAVVMACRRLSGELELLADEVLPPMTKAERKRLEPIFGK